MPLTLRSAGFFVALALAGCAEHDFALGEDDSAWSHRAALASAAPCSRSKTALETDAPVPYVHQVYDTPDSFNGHWACGSTSAVMALAWFARLPSAPVEVSIPVAHSSRYGRYVSEPYTLFDTTFDRAQADASGALAQGAYGACTEDGAAWAWRIEQYLEAHGLVADFLWAPAPADIDAALDAGRLVVLSTKLTSAGHIVLVRGRTADGRFLVNDPYGDHGAGYMNWDGAGAAYAFDTMKPGWFVSVGEAEPSLRMALDEEPPELVLTAGTSATVTLAVSNTGAGLWDEMVTLRTIGLDGEALGVTVGAGDGIATRGSHVVLPGESTTWSVTVEAALRCTPAEGTLVMAPHREPNGWFSSSGAAPITLGVRVEPAVGCGGPGGGGEAQGAEGGSGPTPSERGGQDAPGGEAAMVGGGAPEGGFGASDEVRPTPTRSPADSLAATHASAAAPPRAQSTCSFRPSSGGQSRDSLGSIPTLLLLAAGLGTGRRVSSRGRPQPRHR